MMRLAFLTLLLLWMVFSTGCTTTQSPTPDDLLTVEGDVSVRGNQPFTAIMLETDQRNVYVLTLDEAARTALQTNLPGRYRITGHLYAADWNGKRYAHLRPVSVDRL